MDSTLRIVTHLPIPELWDAHGVVQAQRDRYLVEKDLIALLRQGPVQFIVADVGHQLQWIPSESCFAFWKAEVKGHVLDPDDTRPLEHFPDGVAYTASAWCPADVCPVVLLETHH